MKTLQRFASGIPSVPTSTSWYLSDLGEARGKQELFTRQSPQKLKVLREHALVESTVSSNRIEGVEVDRKRVATLVFGKPVPRDRSEEELRGYREALSLIHERGAKLPVSEQTILRLHRMTRGDIADAGKYKEREGDIIERYPDGRSRVRFRTVRVAETPEFMEKMIDLWGECLRQRTLPPLIVLAALNLDFLCIHPFRDGNGRVSRLLLLLGAYHLGLEVGRYISIERLIEENKERYYETLELSSRGWHQGQHDPWPYVNHLLYILKSAYKEFEKRVGEMKEPKGAKTQLVERAVKGMTGEFSIVQLELACPGVSRDMVRQVLRGLRRDGRVECLGRGRMARWRKRGKIA